MRAQQFLIGLGLALGLTAGTARAQTLGEQGQMAFGAERLFGVIHDSATTTPDGGGGDINTSFTEIALFGQNTVSPYSVPRLGFDFFVIDGLSVGGTIAFAHTSATTEFANQDTDTSGNAFLFAPRAGYAFMFSDNIGIWPRGGVTYFSQSTESDGGDEVSLDGLAFSIDAPLVLSPAPQFAFLAGPAFDIGLTGGVENNPAGAGATTNSDLTDTGIGLYIGLMGWF